MIDKAVGFLYYFGKIIYNCLNNLIIPGTTWSVLGFGLALILLSFGLKLLFSLFSALSISGGFTSGADALSSYNRHMQAKEDRARREKAYNRRR